MPFGLDVGKNKKPLIIKKVTQVVKTPQSSGPARPAAPKHSLPTNTSVSRPSTQKSKVSDGAPRHSYPTPPAERPRTDRKRSTPVRSGLSPSVVQFGDSSDDVDSEDETLRAAKRPRRQKTPGEELPSRNVRNAAAFTDDTRMSGTEFIHGEEIPGLDRRVRYQPTFEGLPAGATVELQYPSALPRERFVLIKGKSDASAYNAIDDIKWTMKMIIKYYLPVDVQARFDHEGKGFPQRLQRAIKKKNEADLRAVIDEWNMEIVRLRNDGTIARTLDNLGRVPSELAERILNQAHARTVSPDDAQLHDYDPGSNEVYGELLPRFVARILNEDTRIRPDQVFVDIGSGVGNVVLQTALEAGCESWGCEIKSGYCDLADLQKQEFEARCRLWGFSHGAINLERGDVLDNDRFKSQALRRADVVVVNNEVFRSDLNNRLADLFLDLKDGCKIISLKSFVPKGHKISTRNLNSTINHLRVKETEYFSDFVSWKDAAGTYFVSTKDLSMVQKFMTKEEKV